MHITMDRYEADWPMVKKGWDVHVHGKAEFQIQHQEELLPTLRAACDKSDQYLPSFVMVGTDGKPLGPILDGDGVICFNFRGDRVIELSQAFTDAGFNKFDRGKVPRLACYAGMMLYDGDAMIPPVYLVSPPQISNTLGEYLAALGQKQFACSETQKYGHVTYFWNGNRARKFSDSLEEYVEIKSDLGPFDARPTMKAAEIASKSIKAIQDGSFAFGRINFANGDMVGHTGNLEAAIVGLEAVDVQLGRLAQVCQEHEVTLIITADHGNCEEMFEGKEADYPCWENPVRQTIGPNQKHLTQSIPCPASS